MESPDRSSRTVVVVVVVVVVVAVVVAWWYQKQTPKGVRLMDPCPPAPPCPPCPQCAPVPVWDSGYAPWGESGMPLVDEGDATAAVGDGGRWVWPMAPRNDGQPIRIFRTDPVYRPDDAGPRRLVFAGRGVTVHAWLDGAYAGFADGTTPHTGAPLPRGGRGVVVLLATPFASDPTSAVATVCTDADTGAVLTQTTAPGWRCAPVFVPRRRALRRSSVDHPTPYHTAAVDGPVTDPTRASLLVDIPAAVVDASRWLSTGSRLPQLLLRTFDVPTLRADSVSTARFVSTFGADHMWLNDAHHPVSGTTSLTVYRTHNIWTLLTTTGVDTALAYLCVPAAETVDGTDVWITTDATGAWLSADVFRA